MSVAINLEVTDADAAIHLFTCPETIDRHIDDQFLVKLSIIIQQHADSCIVMYMLVLHS